MWFLLCNILFGILKSYPETETAAAQFLVTPSNPFYAVEGQDLYLVWIYTLDGSLNAVLLSIVTGHGNDFIGVRFGRGKINITQKYDQARFRAQATSTRAKLIILAVQRSDQATYHLNLVSSKPTSITHNVKVIVQYPPEGVQLQVLSEDTVCKEANFIFNCSVTDANPMELTYHLYENDVMVSNSSSTGIWNRSVTTGGVFVYSCKVTNIIGTAMSTNVSVTVNVVPSILPIDHEVVIEGGNVTELTNNSRTSDAGESTRVASNPFSTSTELPVVDEFHAPEITHISTPHILSRPEMLTLNCTADGNPAPTITWTRLSNGGTVNMPLTFVGKKYEEGYRCTASNEIGNVFKDTSVTRGYCEEACQGERTCRVGLCRCTDGKTGDTCEIIDQPKKTFVVVFVFTMTFKPGYSVPGNAERKELILKIEVALKLALSGTGLTQVRVVSLKRGSVIADLELNFSRSTYEDYLRGRLEDATKDNKLGDLDVKQVVVGGVTSNETGSTTVEPKPIECNIFSKGEKCKEASALLIALIVVAVILVVGLLIVIVVCCLPKKNASGRGSFQNVKVSQRQDPEGNNSLARDYVEPGGSRETLHGNDNTGYDPERPPESTQMVTFNSNNGQMQGIHLPDSRSQKAQPGEGTYADLGDFQPKPTAPATLPPIKKPPTYEETNYAEITQFLKAPVAPKQDEGPQEELALLEAPVEEPDENAKDDAWNNLNNDSAALSRETKEETNADKLYPSLELVKSENKTEQIVVSI